MSSSTRFHRLHNDDTDGLLGDDNVHRHDANDGDNDDGAAAHVVSASSVERGGGGGGGGGGDDDDASPSRFDVADVEPTAEGQRRNRILLGIGLAVFAVVVVVGLVAAVRGEPARQAALAAAAAARAHAAFRLPRDVVPIEYNVSIGTYFDDAPTAEQRFMFYGRMRLRVRMVRGTDSFTLHAANLSIADVRLWSAVGHVADVDAAAVDAAATQLASSSSSGVPDPPAGALQCTFTMDPPHDPARREFLVVTCPGAKNLWHASKSQSKSRRRRREYEHAAADADAADVADDSDHADEFIVFARFQSQLRDSMQGYYRSRAVQADGSVAYLSVTQFESTYARRAFPCFDEPDMKARFRLSLGVPNGYRALANMREHAPAANAPAEPHTTWRWWHFASTPPMSTYLVAWSLHRFTSIEAHTASAVHPVLVRVWADAKEIHNCHLALHAAQLALDEYERWFNISYPFDKLDMMAIPDFEAGAMENWGLITYRDVDVLFDASNTDVDYQTLVAEVVIHELAHQWFGNLVTMDYWTDLWLNEGFATYMETAITAACFPKFDMWDDFALEAQASALRLDALAASHPIAKNLTSAGEINQMFDSISYSKGGSLLRMLSTYIGEPAFKHGLQLYLNAHRYANAVTDDLWHALQQATPTSTLNVTQTMRTWTSQPGFPLLTVNASVGGGGGGGGAGSTRVRVSQCRYYSMADEELLADAKKHSAQLVAHPEWDAPHWLVPLEYLVVEPSAASGGGGDYRVTLHRVVLGTSGAGVDDVITLPSSRAFVVLDPFGHGYFRVHYADATSFERLAAFLATPEARVHTQPAQLPSLSSGDLLPGDHSASVSLRLNRARVLGDAFELAQHGRYTLAQLFAVCGDASSVPMPTAADRLRASEWLTPINGLRTLASRVAGLPEQLPLRTRALEFVRAAQQRLALTDWRTPPPANAMALRKVRHRLFRVAALSFDIDDAVSTALQLADDARGVTADDGIATALAHVEIDVRETVYAVLAAHSHAPERAFARLFQCYTDPTQPQVETERCLKALAHTRTPHLLAGLLQLACEDTPVVRRQDKQSTVARIAAASDAGAVAAWRFVTRGYAWLARTYVDESGFVGKLLTIVARRAPVSLDDVRGVFAAHPDPDSTLRYEETLESLQLDDANQRRLLDALRPVIVAETLAQPSSSSPSSSSSALLYPFERLVLEGLQLNVTAEVNATSTTAGDAQHRR